MTRWSKRSTSAGPRPIPSFRKATPPVSWGWLLGLAAALVVGTWLLCTVFGVLLLSLGTAWILDPVVDEWEKSGKRRDLGILLIFGSFLLLCTALVIGFLPRFLEEFREASGSFEQYLETAPERLGPWVNKLENWLGVHFTSNGGGAGAQTEIRPGQLLLALFPFAVSGTVGLFVLLMNFLLFPVFCFYILRDWDLIWAWFESLVPIRNRPRARHLARSVNEKISGFVWGQLLIASALGLIYCLGLWALGIDMAFVVGTFAGFLSLVPYLGLFVGVALAAGAAALQFGFEWHIGGVVAVFGLAQLAEGLWITPKIMGDKVGLHPLVIMIVLIAGGSFFGLWGMVLAIPVAASVQVLLSDWARLYRASRYYRAA
jgi:predicted PurR-regulated permease PerM